MALFSVERQLTATSGKLRRAREELAVVTEQLAALQSDADDAMTDALVQGGQAKRAAAEATRHVERLAAAKKKLQQQIIDLGREQDALLDRLPAR
jgi:septal ring factor EnvC (AmiA/AmiB activator)